MDGSNIRQINIEFALPQLRILMAIAIAVIDIAIIRIREVYVHVRVI